MAMMTRLTKAALFAGVIALAGCEDALSPDTVDPQQLNTSLQVLSSAYDNNAAFQAVRNLSPHFPQYGFTGVLRAGLPDPEVLRSGGRAAPRLDPRLLAGLRSPGGIHALFPSDVLGKTLVWDTANGGGYVPGVATGAPANGIRIILYVADPSTGQPFVPLQPIGNLDLTDESDASADRLGVLLRLGGATIADYTIAVQTGTTSGSVRAVGYVRSSDGTYQVDFDLLTSVSFSGIHVTYQITGSDGTAVYLDVGVGQAGSSITFRVSRDGNTIEIAGTDDGQAVNAAIRFNGTVVGTITGPSDDPTIAGANGYELTAADIAALEAIFQALAEFVGNFADGIYAPAIIVFASNG